MEKPVILAYALPAETAARYDKVARRFGGSLKAVPVEAYSLPIAGAAGGLAPRAPYLGRELPEPVLVFVNFPEGMLEVFLETLKKVNVPRVSLKAVLTPHNAIWTPDELYRELCREREAFRASR